MLAWAGKCFDEIDCVCARLRAIRLESGWAAAGGGWCPAGRLHSRQEFQRLIERQERSEVWKRLRRGWCRGGEGFSGNITDSAER
jgi:hypothetical protein